MDTMWAVVGLAITLCMALTWAVWCLVATARQERRRRAVRSGHRFRGQGEAITVAEILEEAIERGDGIRLNWPTDDGETSPIQADELGQFPTVVLPRIDDSQEHRR